jgi:hypothetical protein
MVRCAHVQEYMPAASVGGLFTSALLTISTVVFNNNNTLKVYRFDNCL